MSKEVTRITSRVSCDANYQFSSVSNSMVRIIFLAGVMPDEMIGSEIFKGPTTATMITPMKETPKQTGGNDEVCKTRVFMKRVKHQKSGNMVKVWWCRKANGKRRIVKFRKVVTR